MGEIPRLEKSGDSPQDKFEYSLKSLKGRTPDNYRIYVRGFFEWFKTLEDEDPELEYSQESFSRWLENSYVDEKQGRITPLDVNKQLNIWWKDYVKAVKKIRMFKGLKPVSQNTFSNYAKGLNFFIRSLGYSYKVKSKTVKTHGQDKISKSEMRHVIDLTGDNLRRRALLYTLKDTGLRRSDIVLMRIEDFLKGFTNDENGREFSFWYMTTQKTMSEAFVSMGYESVEWVKKYIKDRKSGYIFVTERNYKTHRGSQMDESAVTMTIKRALKNLETRKKLSPHSFRKHFISQMELEGGLPIPMVYEYVGKEIGNNQGAYRKYHRDELEENYMEVYDKVLAIHMETEKDVILESQRITLESQNDLIEEQKQIITLLHARMEAVKKFGEEYERRFLELQKQVKSQSES